jgi:hypothetical protein
VSRTSEDFAAAEEGKLAVTLPGAVEKLILAIGPNEPEMAQIVVEGAEELYCEIRVENRLQDGAGNEVGLKEGAQVEATIEADHEATTCKKESETKESPAATRPAKDK